MQLEAVRDVHYKRLGIRNDNCEVNFNGFVVKTDIQEKEAVSYKILFKKNIIYNSHFCVMKVHFDYKMTLSTNNVALVRDCVRYL